MRWMTGRRFNPRDLLYCLVTLAVTALKAGDR
jgi:hypothetical protein